MLCLNIGTCIKYCTENQSHQLSESELELESEKQRYIVVFFVAFAGY